MALTHFYGTVTVRFLALDEGDAGDRLNNVARHLEEYSIQDVVVDEAWANEVEDGS